MAALTGNAINTSYEGLIKTTDNAALGAVEKEITDGTGVSSTLKLGTTSASFTGTLDLAGATVTGLPGGAPGLVAGVGVDSMISAATLTTLPATSTGTRGIALGNAANGGAYVSTVDAVAIGSNSIAEHNTCVAIGKSAWAQTTSDVAIGKSAHARLGDCVAIGTSAKAQATANIAIGKSSITDVNWANAIAIGVSAATTVAGAVALGANVTASTVDTVSIKALEVQTDSTPTAGGIIMADAGGTDRRINIDAAGALQIDSTPVGGGTTPAMSLMSLPPLRSNPQSGGGGQRSWKTWVTTQGYGRSPINCNNQYGSYGVFPIAEGDTIDGIQFFVQTAQPGATMWAAIYRLGTEANGELILTDRLVDCGTASGATTGGRQINLPSVYTHGAETYGAVAVMIGSDTAGTQISGWQQGDWMGNGGGDPGLSGTFYRSMELFIQKGGDPTGFATPPADLSSTATYNYGANTSNPAYIFIK